MAIYCNIEDKSSLYNFLLEGYYLSQFVETYYDEELTLQQCDLAYRSFEDLLELSQTYFPETTERILAQTLLELHSNKKIRVSYCTTIDKIVFFGGWNFGNIFDEIPNTFQLYDYETYEEYLEAIEYTNDYKGQGQYSLTELCELMKIEVPV